MLNIDLLTSQKFWSETLPELSIGELQEYNSNKSLKVSTTKLEKECERLDYDGHFVFDDVLELAPIFKLKRSIEILNEKGIPAIFLSLYDEFWQMVADLRPLGQTLLGEDYMIYPDYWVWHVDAKNESKGWRPHRESYVATPDPNYPTTSISLWVALSDATTENGCMYVLPKSKDKGYPHTLVFDINTLQDVKALPVKAGSVIGWNQSVFHWGASNSKYAHDSRMSFAMELRRVSDNDKIAMMLESNKVPSYEARLKLVAMQFVHYEHLHKESDLMMKFSRAIVGEEYND